MGPDYEKYRPLLDEFNLADEQKDEFIDVMWVLLDSFVERAHGEDGVQKIVDKHAPDTGISDSDRLSLTRPSPDKGLNHD